MQRRRWNAADCNGFRGLRCERCQVPNAADELQAVDMAVTMGQDGNLGVAVPDYADENVSTKVVKIIRACIFIRIGGMLT